MHKEPIILGIESSCDDTSAAILKGRKVLSNHTSKSLPNTFSVIIEVPA